MTAEVLVMNKTAVALAADSAVTIGSSKTYNSINKLFTLSKHHPVGIMIFGNASFMGIPWEAIIKSYREKLSKYPHNTIGDYAKDFIDYLKNNRELFPESVQTTYFNSYSLFYYQKLRDLIITKCETSLEKSGKLKKNELRKIINETVRSQYASITKTPFMPYASKNFATGLVKKKNQLLTN